MADYILSSLYKDVLPSAEVEESASDPEKELLQSLFQYRTMSNLAKHRGVGLVKTNRDVEVSLSRLVSRIAILKNAQKDLIKTSIRLIENESLSAFAQKEVERLKAEVEALSEKAGQCDRFMRLYESSQKELERWKAEVEALIEKAEQSDRFRRLYESAQKELEENADLLSLKVKLTQAETRLELAEKQLQQSQSDLMASRQEREQCLKDAAKHKALYDEKSKELNALRTKYADLNCRDSHKQEIITELRQKLAKAKIIETDAHRVRHSGT